MLGILIFIHELGHFWTARLLKVKVDEFSIGFGKRLFVYKKNNIEYSIRLIPYGGFVKLAGGETRTQSVPNYNEFLAKPLWVKILILVAGSSMNVVLAIFLFSNIAFYTGVPDTRPIVGEAIEGKPASISGIKQKDIIVQIDEKNIKSWNDMTSVIRNSKGEELNLKIARDGRDIFLQVTPVLDKVPDMFGKEQEIFFIGIAPQIQHFNLLGSLKEGTRQAYFWSTLTLKGLFRIITGEDKVFKAIGGPLMIAEVTARASRAGFAAFFFIMAIISIALAVINMFPIPGITDGGHTIVYLFEKAINRPLSPRAYEIVTRIGFAFIIFLMFIATAADVWRFWGQRLFEFLIKK